MKNDPVTKLYGVLSDKEKAVLAFAYTSRRNEIEIGRIESTMPMQYFTGLPLEYRQGVLNQLHLAMAYAIEYWRLVANIQTCATGALVRLQADDPEEWRPIVERHGKLEAQLLSLEAAFDDVCTAHGLAPDTMRGMAGERFYETSTPVLTPDTESLAGMREIFAGMMEGRKNDH